MAGVVARPADHGSPRGTSRDIVITLLHPLNNLQKTVPWAGAEVYKSKLKCTIKYK